MKKIGLVLCGGGAKGAYQAGVFRVLEEFGLLDDVVAISGSSIGAINGALFLQYTPEEIEHLWLSCNWPAIFSLNKENTQRVSQIIDSINNRQLSPFFGMMNLVGVATKMGLPLKRDGFNQAFRYFLNPSVISSQGIDLYASCLNVKKNERRFILLNCLSSKQIKDVLLATTAVPVLYESVYFEDAYYCDPLKVEKAPLQPLLETECETIIIVYLDRRFKLNQAFIKDKRIIEIMPSEELGTGIYGSVDFRPSILKQYMELGSEDAYRILYQALSQNPKAPSRVSYKNK